MEFTCRPGPLHKTWLYRLNDQTLELLDEKGEIKQTVEFNKVHRIQQYDALAAKDPETGSYDSEFCKIVPSRGRSVYLRNGSYVQPSGKMGEFAVNMNEQYVAFLTELKRRVSAERPNVPVTHGWLLASLVWWGLVPLGVCFLAFSVAGFVMDEFLTALSISAFCLPFGLILITGGAAMGRTYWPHLTTVSKDVSVLDASSPNVSAETRPTT